MFSSPAVRVYSSENVDNLAQRKPGTDTTAKTRKPFVDKPVNSKSASINALKQKLAFTKEVNVSENQKTKLEDDLDATDFAFSHKDMDDSYEDFHGPFRGKQDILNILKSYAGIYDTPPPSPESNKFFCPEPIPEFSLSCERTFDDGYCWDDEDLDVDIPTESDLDDTV